MIHYHFLSVFLRKKIGILKLIFADSDDGWFKPLIYVSVSERGWEDYDCWHSYFWEALKAVELLLDEHGEFKLLEKPSLLFPLIIIHEI